MVFKSSLEKNMISSKKSHCINYANSVYSRVSRHSRDSRTLIRKNASQTVDLWKDFIFQQNFYVGELARIMIHLTMIITFLQEWCTSLNICWKHRHSFQQMFQEMHHYFKNVTITVKCIILQASSPSKLILSK